MLPCSIVGGPATVREGLAAFRERTGAAELMIVSDLYDSALRRRSFEIIAEAARELGSRRCPRPRRAADGVEALR
jgi:alkanesulfonate monooxygenase SsuD/methylene tetrahydromethanopterin reductase-like flavin-dependent oxidoreductase (luciferase family)